MKKTFLATVISLMAIVLLAQNAVEPLGSGTIADPYQIANLDNLYWMSTNQSSWYYHFIQTADIDATVTASWNIGDHDNDVNTANVPMGWVSIGNSSAKFYGSYDGQGFKISNLYQNKTAYWGNSGLFGYICHYLPSTEPYGIKNLELVNVNITGNQNAGGIAGYNEDSQIYNCKVSGSITAQRYVGGIVGYTVKPDRTTASVLKCINTATITGIGDSSELIGGIAGQNGNSLIDKCFNTGNIGGVTGIVGGVVGDNGSTSVLKESYNLGSVTSTLNYVMIGGLAGRNESSTILNCYNKGLVHGNVVAYAGGLVGYNNTASITNCYNAGDVTGFYSNTFGSIAGSIGYSNVNDTYWDNETTLIDGFGGSNDPNTNINSSTGLSTFLLQSGNFANWDWDTIWQTNPGQYPTLRENPDATLPVTLSSFSAVCTASETVSIKWTTQSESSLFGYYLFRNSQSSLSGADRMNGQVISAGNQSTEQQYIFTDTEVMANQTYYYWLQSVECDGSSEYFGPVSVTIINDETVTPVPAYSFIENVYPNPISANQPVNIKLTVGQNDQASMKIFNSKGQLVKQYSNLRTGQHHLAWNGKDDNNNKCATGIYFYQLHSNTSYVSGKMILIK